MVHDVEIVVGGLEYIRDRENRIGGVELLQRAGRNLGDIKHTGLDQLYHGAVVAELAVRVHVKGIIGFLLHFIA